MSYINNIITGSMSTEPDSRGIIGYNFSGSVVLSWDDTYSKRFIPSHEIKADISRNVTLVDQSETFYDTLLPDPGKITSLNGGKVVQVTTLRAKSVGTETNALSSSYIMLSTIGSTEPGEFIDNKWLFSFPFEPKYSLLTRKINPVKGMARERITFTDILGGYSTGSTTGKAFSGYSIAYKHSGSSVQVPTNYYYLVDRDVSLTPPSYPQNIYNITKPLNSDFLKHYFGMHKSRPGISPTEINYSGGSISFLVGRKKAVEFHESELFPNEPGMGPAADSPHLYGYGAAPEGWKYGILNALPYRSTAVFRRDRYGQFRDMLEQRKDSKFFGAIGNARPGINSDIDILDSPVKCKFVDSSGTVVPPAQTNSSNLSNECTSSLPYFDGISRN
jgi:hypothetical protein